MDHLKAQQIISDALDELAVDRWELSEAKEHCRTCSDCGAFVRALIAVQRTPLPEPPEDLADRVMTRVRAEAQQRAIAKARALASPKAKPAPSAEPAAPATSYRDLWDRARDPRNRRQVAAWAGVAATVFILAGWGAIAGVRAILIPPRLSEITIVGTDTSTQPPIAGTAPESFSSTQDQRTQASAPAPSMIEVSGTIYKLRGTNVTVNLDDLKRSGGTRSALDTGERPRSYDVLAGDDPLRVYVMVGDTAYEFEAVTRTYEERTYALTGGPIEKYGDWPELPTGIQEPTSPDGSPTFALSGTDGSGATIYVLANRSTAEGIALPPSPPATDPMAGSPNWTWWTPVR